MTRTYTVREFLRQMPLALLERFFHARGLFKDLDFSAMKDGKAEELWGAWLYLPNEERDPANAEMREIFEMSCEKGCIGIIDEARWQLRDKQDELTAFVETLSSLPNHYHRAMVTYLDHHFCWKGATHFYHADSLTRAWRKRKNMGYSTAAVDPPSIDQLAQGISGYFRHMEGRGTNCIVEPLRRGELDYFFAYPEDYSQQSIEWVNGEFGRRPHNPAFEVIFVYSQKDGALDLNFRGSKKAVQQLQEIFASNILKLEKLPPDPKDERVYDLNPLSQKQFSFTCAVGSGIESVVVKKLRLSSRVIKGDRITVEADTTDNSNAVYALLEQIGKSVPLHQYNVTQVELAASVSANPGEAPKNIAIRIGHPNSCSLKYDEMDWKLREMLEASGIEPKELESDNSNQLAIPVKKSHQESANAT